MRLIFFILTFSLCNLYATPFESANGPWGADAELIVSKKDLSVKTRSHPGQKVCLSMIRFFQNYITDIDGPRSSFYPTSSQYALEAIQKHGVFKGIAMGCDRLMRENKETWVYQRTDKHGMERKLDLVR